MDTLPAIAIKIAIALTLSSVIAACSRPTVLDKHPNKAGVYVLSYDKPFKIADGYDEGVNLLSRMKAANSSAEFNRIYQSAMDDVISHYLVDKGYIPRECGNGIEFLGHGRDENGSGASTFRCK